MTDFFFFSPLPFPSNNRTIKLLKGIIRFVEIFLTSINKRWTRLTYLETSHVTWIARILKAVLVAL